MLSQTGDRSSRVSSVLLRDIRVSARINLLIAPGARVSVGRVKILPAASLRVYPPIGIVAHEAFCTSIYSRLVSSRVFGSAL
jgi:hypothetical protein